MCGGGSDSTYDNCSRCGANSYKGKRLAIAVCNKCNEYFCKSCAGSAYMGGAQACPKCDSSDFKQKGFVG